MSSMDEREQAAREEDQPASGPESGTRAPESGERPLHHGEQRGFAAMDMSKQRQIASKGGKAAHEKGTAHEFTPEEARLAGKKGGEAVSKNRQHMAEIGRKGGLAAHHRTENGEENKESAEQATSPPEVKTVREAEPPQNVPAGPGSTAQTTQLQPTELLSQPDRQS